MGKQAYRTGVSAFAAAAILLMLAAIFLLPARAFAADNVAYSQDEAGNVTYYATSGEAINAGLSGKAIVMTADWNMTDPIKVEKNQKLTIEMNGHEIRRTAYNTPWWSQYGERHAMVFHLYENAQLTLTGNMQPEHEFNFMGYNRNSTKVDMTTTSGGLVTSGVGDGECYGGFWMEGNGGTVTLEGVTAAGFSSPDTGFFVEGKNCTINLKNASVDNNYSTQNGGAAYVAGKYCTFNLDASSISNNGCLFKGGAIYSAAGGTSIYLNNGSKINNNTASSDGGGIFFYESYYKVVSPDRTGEMSGNRTVNGDYQTGGGAISITAVMLGTNEGLIEGITFTKNRSLKWYGGAIFTRQEYTTIRDCTFTDNYAKKRGGAIAINNDLVFIDGCTITGNQADEFAGGVYVSQWYNVHLSGLLTITGNTGGSNMVPDDLHLWAQEYANEAYGIGNVKEGSKIGICNDKAIDHKLFENLTKYYEGTFFLNRDGYHLSYNAEDGELWQRAGEVDYAVTINGNGTNRYEKGSNVTVNGLSSDKSKVFLYWSTTNTTGLEPIDSYIADPYNPILSFTMPQNDVHLVAVYGSKLSVAQLYVNSPKAGQKFPATGTLSWLNSLGTISKASIPLQWYEVGEGDKLTPVSGNAAAGKSYVAYAVARESSTKIPVFDPSLSSKTLAQYVDNVQTGNVASASVDSRTGTLTLITTPIELPGEEGAEGDTGTVSVKMSTGDLPVSSDGATSADAAVAAVAEDGTETLVVTYTKGSDVTVCAPEIEGYNFNHWEKVPEGYVYDDELGTVSIEDADADNIDLYAVYVPVATEVNVGLSAPAAGEALVSTINKLDLTGSNGTTYDLAKTFGDEGGNLAVNWSPDLTSGHAAHHTAYTARIDLGAACDDEGEIVDVDKVLSPDVVVKLAGEQTDGVTAGFLIEDGELYLCLTFPETGSLKLAEVVQLDDATLTFDEACARQSAQESYLDGLNHWQLPKSTVVTLNDGTEIDADIAWDIPTGFDSNKLAAQEFTVAGSIELPSWVEAGDVSTELSLTVKVDAPVIDWTFPDVDYSASSWYAASVAYCTSRGLILGYDDGTFGTGDTMQRAQLATILWRNSCKTAAAEYDGVIEQTAGTDAVEGIEDAKYYTAAANWAVENGVIEGYERAGQDKRDFAPYDGLTFEQLVSIVAKASGADYESSDLSELDRFADAAEVSDWAKHAMAWAVSTGLVSGWDNGDDQARELKPGMLVSRERAATVLANAYKAGILD